MATTDGLQSIVHSSLRLRLAKILSPLFNSWQDFRLMIASHSVLDSSASGMTCIFTIPPATCILPSRILSGQLVAEINHLVIIDKRVSFY